MGLEYRGYDNAEIAYFSQDSLARTIKKVGKMATLKEYVKSTGEVFHCGIGHTRWATYGGVTDVNVYPHSLGQVTLTRNGIIKNYHQLTQEYELEGYLASQTDSEVAVTVLDSAYRECGQDPLKAIAAFAGMLEGSYGFCILFADHLSEIYAVRKVGLLVAPYTHSGALVISDLIALIFYTREYFMVPESCVVRLTPYKVRVYNMGSNHMELETLEVSWNTDAAMKDGYPHFMSKGVHEQPDALKNITLPRMVSRLLDFRDDGILDSIFAERTQICIIAYDTAIYMGMVAKALMEPMLRIPVTVSVAPELRYGDPLTDPRTLVTIISRSRETIDTLVAMDLAKSLSSPTLSIINVKGSTIARGSDYASYTHAGPEIAVAGTKAYSVQPTALYMIGCRMAPVRRTFSHDATKKLMGDLMGVIPAMKVVIGQSEFTQSFVRHLIHERDTFFTGRGLDYTFSLEGALKLKEISYIHVEAYAAGGLKHGIIALICDNAPAIAIATQDHVFAETISDIREVKTRGAYVTPLVRRQSMIEDGVVNMEPRIPDPKDRFTVFPITMVLQPIAYYASIGKHLDISQPRNLARSITVG